MNNSRLWPAGLIAGAVMAVLLTFGFPHSPLRPAVVLGFLLVGPGMTVLRPFHLASGVTRLMLAAVASLAIETALTLIMAYARLWSPEALLVLLAAACVVAGKTEITGARRAPALSEES